MWGTVFGSCVQVRKALTCRGWSHCAGLGSHTRQCLAPLLAGLGARGAREINLGSHRWACLCSHTPLWHSSELVSLDSGLWDIFHRKLHSALGPVLEQHLPSCAARLPAIRLWGGEKAGCGREPAGQALECAREPSEPSCLLTPAPLGSQYFPGEAWAGRLWLPWAPQSTLDTNWHQPLTFPLHAVSSGQCCFLRSLFVTNS